nr:DNA helicase [Tanacetum cinerariifolium]
NERSSDSGVCGSLSPFVSSVSRPCKPLLSGGYRSPQSNYSVGGKVVVLDFGNSEVRLESCESFFGVNHSKGSRHSAYEFPNDSSFSGSYIRSGLMVLDFENYVTRSDPIPFEISVETTFVNVGYFVLQESVLLGVHLEHASVHLFRYLLKKMVEAQMCDEDNRMPFNSCIDWRGLDVIRNKKTKRTRSSSVGSGYHEAANDVNHGGTLCAIVFENGSNTRTDYDVIIESMGGFPQRVNKLHPSHMSLQFLLLFVYGEPDFYPQMKQRQGVDKRLSMNQYYMFQLHECLDCYALLFRGGRLFQQGDREGSQVGGRLILPRTFTRDPRYMYSHYLDVCRVLGNPQYFVTFTCNVNWPKIKRYILQFLELTFADRADIVVRVFQQKVKDFCTFLKDRQVFGSVTGLDRYISMELLDPDTDPEGYRVVSEMMVHGPCGLLHSDAVCMKEGKCGKNFLKKFIAHTFFDMDGYVRYRRRETHTRTSRRGVDLDNGYIVPYNRTDKIATKIVRQVGDPPADTNNGQPVVQILSIHLEGMQPVTFKDHQPLTLIVNDEAKTKTTLTEWLKYKKCNGDGLYLTYIDFTKEFVWYSDTKSWRRRQRRNSGLIGRLANVHPTSDELFFLRILICHQKGCKTFDAIRTVNKRLYPTFRAAYEALGLLGDDKEWHIALEEAAFSASSQQLRSLFVQILIFCDVADPMRLWKAFWQRMSNDVPRTVSNSLHIQDLYMNDPELEGSVLYAVESHDRIKKTFLWRMLINNMRSKGKIGLAVASSGIVSLLLLAVHTTHSRFKLPLDLTDESLCNIKKNTNAESLLAETSLIIWDESPMNDIRCFEALDKTLRDVLDAPEKLFGGKTIVHGENMRLRQPGLNKYENPRAANFASWLLEIGDGKTETVEENSDGDSSWITVPEELCIPDDDNGLKNLIGFIYDENTLQHPTAVDLQQKAIACPKNTTADEINKTVLEMLHGAPIMLLRNMNLQGGMCNRTQMIIKKLSSRLIEANVITGTDGDVVEVTLRDKMATEFNREEFEKMEQHVTFAISSCKANIYGGIQLSGTPMTHYYFNLEIPRLEELREQQRLTLHPPLQISKEIRSDINAKKNRNKFPFSTLLQQNPDGYRVYDENGEAYCVNHGLQKPPTYRYIFKALLIDQSATASVTFFTPNADVLIGSSSTELVKKYGVPNPREFPDEILSLNGRTHIFQVHNNPSCIQGRVDYYFDDIIDKPLQIARPSQSSEPSIEPTQIGTPVQLPQTSILAQSLTVTPLPITPETPGTPAEKPAASIGVTEGVSSDTPSIPTSSSETTTKNIKRALFETESVRESKKKKNDSQSPTAFHS